MQKVLLTIISMILIFINLIAQNVIYSDGFETGSFDTNYWQPIPDTINNGVVDVLMNIQGAPVPHSGFFGVAMGKTSVQGFALNKLDLHLNLSTFQNVDLSFWIKDTEDETQIQDAIWFSNDGGSNFLPVYPLDPANWTNQWGQLPPIDIDRLAANINMPLTDSFVIRFQQEEEAHPQDGLFFSADGGENFSPVYNFVPNNWPNNQYQEISIDVDSIINTLPQLTFSDSFVIRFQQYDNLSFSNIFPDGIFLDDIMVTGVAAGIEDHEDKESKLPLAFALEQNYPNPFNPAATIRYTLPNAAIVTLTVYDLLGRQIAILVNEEKKPAGQHEAIFNAGNLGSGMYLYQLQTNNFREVRKMLLVR